MGEKYLSCGVFDLPAFAPEHRGGPRECADKLLSEAAEVFGEVRIWLTALRCGDLDEFYSEDVATEIADVLQVCRNICEVCDIDREMLAHAMGLCVAKNEVRDGNRYLSKAGA